MTKTNYEKGGLPHMSGRFSATKILPAIAMFRTMPEHESFGDIFGDQGGYPSIHEGSSFIHEGRRMIPVIHGDDFSEQVYQLDGCFTLEFEEA